MRHQRSCNLLKVDYFVLSCLLVLVLWFSEKRLLAEDYLFNDSHLHITNYIQKESEIHELLKIIGDKVGRAAIFGIPLQQEWSYANTGNYAPTYYLHTDAPLYYYSFVDAQVALAYKSLSPEKQARFDPMIVGFNPADMYAVDHIKRVLQLFPGVFSGIGEFTVHKEFVSSKIAGGAPSLTSPALDRIFDFAAETGLVTLLHNDVDLSFAKPGQEPYMVKQLKELILRHPDTIVIWAHIGLGRTIQPVKNQVGLLERALAAPEMKNLYFDISWDEAGKYIVASQATLERMAGLINKYPDRFLFGTDEVTPEDQRSYLKVFDLYAPLLAALSNEAKEKLLKGNYTRLFDAARKKVRAWEAAHLGASYDVVVRRSPAGEKPPGE